MKPVAFQGRVSESKLEDWIVAQPDLAGEPLLILGRQLAEFEEDKDRLDVLAVDGTGELVLIELKVDDEFRVTDLQALAYAGAYARCQPEQLAHPLQRHLNRQPQTVPGVDTAQEVGGPEQVSQPGGDQAEGAFVPDGGAAAGGTGPKQTLEDAKERIIAFLGRGDFDDWQFSQHVRIKLIAPGFPRRVLQNVKWLSSVYGMPIEAIGARLFESHKGSYSISFERLLPLPDEDEFDLTVRQHEDRQRNANISRRPAVLPLLVQAGHLTHGQTLFLVPFKMYEQYYDAENVAFQARVHAPDNGTIKLAWRANAEAVEQILAPSLVAYNAWKSVIPEYEGDEYTTAVATSFTTSPGGQTLAQLAEATGAW